MYSVLFYRLLSGVFTYCACPHAFWLPLVMRLWVLPLLSIPASLLVLVLKMPPDHHAIVGSRPIQLLTPRIAAVNCCLSGDIPLPFGGYSLCMLN